MESINSLSRALIILINAGAAFRILVCFISMSSSEPHKVIQMKDRIKKLLIFVAIANSIYGIHAMAMYYFGGGY